MSDILEDVPFRAHAECKDGVCIVYASGEADLYAAPELDRQLRVCEGDGVREVVVDLTEVTILDSTALGVLVAAHGRLTKLGIAMKLASSDRLVRRVLRITGLDRVLEVYATAAEAIDGGVAIKDGKGGAAVRDGTGAASES